MSAIAENTISLIESLPDEVSLVAVSKTRSEEEILESYSTGQRLFGENRPQEMKAKFEVLPKDIQWHMIGHLQTNKVKNIIDFVSLIHSVDSLSLLQEVEKRAASAGRIVDVLMQVHIAQEEHKFGFTQEALRDFFDRSEWQRFTHVNIRGLMGMATFSDDIEVVKSEFVKLKRIFELSDELVAGKILGYNILSMGMSGDYQLAIEAGSTMVRVGSKIFGARH